MIEEMEGEDQSVMQQELGENSEAREIAESGFGLDEVGEYGEQSGVGDLGGSAELGLQRLTDNNSAVSGLSSVDLDERGAGQGSTVATVAQHKKQRHQELQREFDRVVLQQQEGLREQVARNALADQLREFEIPEERAGEVLQELRQRKRELEDAHGYAQRKMKVPKKDSEQLTKDLEDQKVQLAEQQAVIKLLKVELRKLRAQPGAPRPGKAGKVASSSVLPASVEDYQQENKRLRAQLNELTEESGRAQARLTRLNLELQKDFMRELTEAR